MKKKIALFAAALLLLLSVAMPAMAEESWYGRFGEAGDSETQQTISTLSNSISEGFGVDAIYIVNSDESGSGSAKPYYESVKDSLFEYVGEDYIIYTCTTGDAYVTWGGKAEDVYDTDKVNNLFEVCEEYENAGQYDMAAVTFLSNVYTDLAAGTMGGSFEADGQLTATTGEDTTANINALTTPAPDSEYFRNIVDYAGLLDSGEAEKLQEKLAEISERQQFDVVIVTTNDLGGKTAEAYADDYFDYNGYGYGANHDGCLLLFDMGNRYMHLSTTGFGITAITDAGIEYINDEIYTYARNDDWVGAFNSYANNVDKFVTQAKKGEPYDVGSMPRAKKSAKDIIKGLGISLVVGLIAAFIARGKVKKDYEKAVRQKANASDYLVNGSLQITGAYENFLYSNVTQTKIERESSSGGGSSTHSGSSGTSHGGGGRSF